MIAPSLFPQPLRTPTPRVSSPNMERTFLPCSLVLRGLVRRPSRERLDVTFTRHVESPVLLDMIPPFICAVTQGSRYGHQPHCRWGSGEQESPCEQLQPQSRGDMEGLGSRLLACLPLSPTQLPWAGVYMRKKSLGDVLFSFRGILLLLLPFNFLLSLRKLLCPSPQHVPSAWGWWP